MGIIVTPKGEYVKKYNKCFAFFVLSEKKQNGRLRREFDKHVSLFRKLPSKKYWVECKCLQSCMSYLILKNLTGFTASDSPAACLSLAHVIINCNPVMSGTFIGEHKLVRGNVRLQKFGWVTFINRQCFSRSILYHHYFWQIWQRLFCITFHFVVAVWK